MKLIVLFLFILNSLNIFCQEIPDTIHFPVDNLDLAVYEFIDSNNSKDTLHICYHPCPFLTRVSQTYNGMYYNEYPMIIFKCESEKEIDFIKYQHIK